MNKPIVVQHDEFDRDMQKWFALASPTQVVHVMRGEELSMAIGGSFPDPDFIGDLEEVQAWRALSESDRAWVIGMLDPFGKTLVAGPRAKAVALLRRCAGKEPK